MIDHLMMFATEAAAMAALPAYVQTVSQEVEGNTFSSSAWVGPVLAGQSVGFDAVWSEPDDGGDPSLITPAVVVPGYFVTVSLPDASRSLIDMPDAACRLVAERATGSIIYAADDVDAALLASARISPVPAGAGY